MGSTLSVIHTASATVGLLGGLLRKQLPGVRIVNIVDDSLIGDVMAVGEATRAVARRICQYMLISEDMGADAILSACSSVGEIADLARNLVSVPIVRIDEAMAEIAVEAGKVIGVVATTETTLGPTVRLIERKARERGREVLVRQALCKGALAALLEGNVERHDEMVTTEVAAISGHADAVVLAQASMAQLAPRLAENVGIPVLSSPEPCVERLRRMLASSPP